MDKPQVHVSPLDTTEHGLAVAVHPWYVAYVPASVLNAVFVHPLPEGLVFSDCGRSGSRIFKLHVSGPACQLLSLRFSENGDRNIQNQAVLLLAASASEAFVWNLVGYTDPGEPTRFVGFNTVPPLVPTLAFDETGAVAAVGGTDSVGYPAVFAFESCSGRLIGCMPIPSLPSLCGKGLQQATAPSVCLFLRGEFSHVMLTAIQEEFSSNGRVMSYDLRGCGQKEKTIAACHELAVPRGAPFSTATPLRGEDSSFVLGGRGMVHLLQVIETAGRIHCSVLAEIPLQQESLPVWLQSSGGLNRSHAEEDERADTGTGDVITTAACSVLCESSPSILGLIGSLALAITTEGSYIVFGHGRKSEQVLGNFTSTTAAATVIDHDSGSVVLAVRFAAFGGGGEVIWFQLPRDVVNSTNAVCGEVGTSILDLLADCVEDSTFEDPPICSVIPLSTIPKDKALGRALEPPGIRGGSAPSSSGTRSPVGANAGASSRVRAGSAPLRARSNSGRLAATPKNQPVTFHRKVKSAGYGPPTEPPRVLGKPRLSTSRASCLEPPDFGAPSSKPRSSLHISEGGTKRSSGSSGRYLSADGGAPLEHVPDAALTSYEGSAVINLQYTPQATHLVTVCSDTTVTAQQLPLNRNRAGHQMVLSGHEGNVLSISPSHSDSQSTGGGGCPLLLTSSTDHTVRLWAMGGPQASHELMRFDRVKTNTKSFHADDNPRFGQVQDAQFVCLDGAIMIASGSRMGVYKYELHTQDAKDDIKRLQRFGSYRCCGLLSLPREPTSGHSIAAIAANNALISGTVVVASSSKQIYVWDVASEKVLARADEAMVHSRPITCLRLSQPHHQFQSAASLDLFYSTAMDGTSQLWDLRTMKVCRTFEGGHVHSCQRLRTCLSPCLRYFCSPSEDGGVCVYDVRSGGVLGNRHAHRDVVSAVDLNPRTGCMASGGFDGKVHFYRVPSTSGKPPLGRPPGGMIEKRHAEKTSGVREVEMDAM